MRLFITATVLGFVTGAFVLYSMVRIRRHSYAKVVYAMVLAVLLFAFWYTRHAQEIRYMYNKLFYEGFLGWLKTLEDSHPIVQRILPNRIDYHTYHKKIVIDNTLKKPAKKYWSILIDYHGRNNVYEASSRYDCVITTQASTSKAIFIPRWSFFLSTIPFIDAKSLLTHTSYTKPTKFCVTLENPNLDVFQRECLEMVRYYQTVDVLKKLPHDSTIPTAHDILVYQPYRFVLVFDDPKWVSEQLLLPLLAGCIPVYFGGSDVESYFNPKRFLHMRTFSSFQQCVARMLALDKHPAEAQKILQEPLMSEHQFRSNVGWYQRDSPFFEQFYSAIPELKTRLYKPYMDRTKLDPKKCIKIINLDRSRDRWEKMLQQLQQHPLKHLVERFPAVDGKLFEEQRKHDIACKRRILGGKRSSAFKPGEIGVYFSNMDLYHTLTQDPQNDYYVVFEDDVDLTALQNPQVYVDEAPMDWDVLFIGVNKVWCKPANVSYHQSSESVRYFRLAYECMPGNFAYIVRKRAAQYYVNFGTPMELPIDEFQRYQSANLNIYIREPSVVEVEYTNDSTISNGVR